VMDMVRRAQESRSRSQDPRQPCRGVAHRDRAGRSAATFIAWLAIAGDVKFAVARAVTVMVIELSARAGPWPFAVIAVSTSLSASHGLLIRDRAASSARGTSRRWCSTDGHTHPRDASACRTSCRSASLPRRNACGWRRPSRASRKHPIAKGVTRAAAERKLKPSCGERVKKPHRRGATGARRRTRGAGGEIGLFARKGARGG